MYQENIGSKVFRSKPHIPIDINPTTFNGLPINIETDEHLNTTKVDKINKIKAGSTQKEFASIRALGQNIGVNVRPEICAPIQLIVPGDAPPTEQQLKALAKTLKFLQQVKRRKDSLRTTGNRYDKVSFFNGRLIWQRRRIEVTYRAHRRDIR